MTKSLVLGSSIFPRRASFSKHSLQELTAPPPPPVDPFAALDALEELAGPAPEDDVTPIVAPELQARNMGVRRNRMNDIYHSVAVVLTDSCLTYHKFMHRQGELLKEARARVTGAVTRRSLQDRLERQRRTLELAGDHPTRN